jgi:hypothetical protein
MDSGSIYSFVFIKWESGTRETWVDAPILSLTGCVVLGKLLYSLSLCTQPSEVENKRALQVCMRELLSNMSSTEGNGCLFYDY